MSWILYKVKEVCDEIIDCVNKTAPKSTVVTPYKMIRTTNVRNGEIDLDNVFNVTEEIYQKWTRRGRPQRNDIILTREAPVGEVGILRVEDTVFLGQRTMMYRANESLITPHFLYYSLRSDFVQNQLRSFSSGSTVSHVRVPDAESFLVNLPHLQTQKRIASILSNYDDLIENNLKRIKLLEETAQNIYKEWFVNFRFPNYENIGFNSESGLPFGWNKRKVADFFEFIKGIEVGSANYESFPNTETLPFLRVGDISKRDGKIYVKKSLVKDKIVEKNDILISFDGSIGSVGYGLEGSYSTGLRKITSKTEIFGTGFMYCLVKSNNIQNTIKAHAKGTTILHAGTSIIHLEFPLATDNVILSFNQITNPIFEQMVSLNYQNQKLKEARDILLPRLMNRTIEV